MNLKDAEVNLTISIVGSHKEHGQYSYFNNAKESGVITEKRPIAIQCKKNIHLGNEFVKGALAEPPNSLKDRIRGNKWKGISEEKRIALHVNNLVKSLHPEHLGYKMEIL